MIPLVNTLNDCQPPPALLLNLGILHGGQADLGRAARTALPRGLRRVLFARHVKAKTSPKRSTHVNTKSRLPTLKSNAGACNWLPDAYACMMPSLAMRCSSLTISLKANRARTADDEVRPISWAWSRRHGCMTPFVCPSTSSSRAMVHVLPTRTWG